MKLVYRAGFESPALQPLVDITGTLGPLQLMQAPDLPGTPAGKKDVLDPPGLRLKVERTSDLPVVEPAGDAKDNCYVGAVVYPYADDINLLMIRATFELPQCGIADPDYGWAMVIFARTGNVEHWPTRDERTTVTLQSSSKSSVLSARMNTPGGAVPGTPYPYADGTNQNTPIPDDLREGIFASNDAQQSRFTLELLIERKRRIAVAGIDAKILLPRGDRNDPSPRLWASFCKRRSFIHPLIRPPVRFTWPLPDVGIDSIGFAIAIANGNGTVSATIRDFRIYRLNFIDLWIANLKALFFCR